LRKLVAGSFNFALVQAYGCFDEILLYLIIDFKTNPFNTFFCWASFFSAVGFLALGCFLVFFNIWKVKQYQSRKNQARDLEASMKETRVGSFFIQTSKMMISGVSLLWLFLSPEAVYQAS